MTDLIDPQLSPGTQADLRQMYGEQISNSTSLPKSTDQQSWLYTEFDRARKIAAAVPDDRNAQMRAAIMLANFGQPAEASEMMEKLLRRQPEVANGHQILGEIRLIQGDLERSRDSFQTALKYAKTNKERLYANLKLGEVYLNRKEFDLAKAHFQAAVKLDPRMESSIDALRQKNQDHTDRPGETKSD